MSNKFTTAKTEFQYMSSERAMTEPESDCEDVNKHDTGDIMDSSIVNGDGNCNNSCQLSANGSDSYCASVAGSDSYNSAENTRGSNSPSDSHCGEPSVNAIDENGDNDSTFNGQYSDDRAFSEPHLTCIKKPKLESHSTCDIQPNTNPFENREYLHQIMSHANGSDECSVPFPTPDHNYAISPQKDEPPKEEPKEEIKAEPLEFEGEERSKARYKVIKT